MIVVDRDLWDALDPAAQPMIVVVPTNLSGVMGRGVARQAADRFDGLEAAYKAHLLAVGRYPAIWMPPRDLVGGHALCLLPVKVAWSAPADVDLIAFGIGQLAYFSRHVARSVGMPTDVALPLLGAGFGGLDPDDQRARLERLCPPWWVLVDPVTAPLDRYARSLRPSTWAGRADPRAWRSRSVEAS